MNVVTCIKKTNLYIVYFFFRCVTLANEYKNYQLVLIKEIN
jgi:hypothetical protein